MTDEQLEQRLRDWYRAEIPDREVAPVALRTALGAIPRESTLGGRRFGSRRGITLLAAAALVGLLAGSAVVGGFPSPSTKPAVVVVSLRPSAQPSFSAQPSAIASPGLIAYATFGPLKASTRECPTGARRLYQPYKDSGPGCSRIWVSNTDGTGAHELVPDHPGNQTPLEWSPDGTLLLFEDAAGLWLVDASGTIVQSFPFEGLCPIECGGIGVVG